MTIHRRVVDHLILIFSRQAARKVENNVGKMTATLLVAITVPAKEKELFKKKSK